MAQTQETKEVAKKQKIRLLQDCYIGDNLVRSGTEVEVDQDIAAEFCDKTFDGYHPFYGNQPEMVMAPGEFNPLARKKIVRAVRI